MSTFSVAPEQITQFKEEGYFILERVIPHDQLIALREECGKFITEFDNEYAEHIKQSQSNNNTNSSSNNNNNTKEIEDACNKVANFKNPFTLADIQTVRPSTTEDELLHQVHNIKPLPRKLFELDNSMGISHPGKRYFISFKFLNSTALQNFVFGEVMQGICRATIGEKACLFLEQFVVKGPEVGMKFGWHQDSGYIPFAHKPYVTCWCALDDVDEENGTIYVTSFSKDPESKKGVLPHHKESGSNDMMCYKSDVPLTKGVPMIVPAGSIVVFSSLIPHSSGANKTKHMRRAYIVQYSDDVIHAQCEGLPLTGPRHFADPVF